MVIKMTVPQFKLVKQTEKKKNHFPEELCKYDSIGNFYFGISVFVSYCDGVS